MAGRALLRATRQAAAEQSTTGLGTPPIIPSSRSALSVLPEFVRYQDRDVLKTEYDRNAPGRPGARAGPGAFDRGS